jgi:hypothetical protein
VSRRSPIAAALAVAATACAVALSGTGTASADRPPKGPAAVHLLKCSTGKAATRRSAVFRGSMSAVSGTASMQMRFDLSEKVGRDAYRPVTAPGLGVWRESRAGVLKFAYRQRINGLQKGTAYRVLVSFRWLGDDGGTVATAERRSRPCRQPGKLANLIVLNDVQVTPGATPDTARYIAWISNAGKARAHKVAVRLSVDGAEVNTVAVGALDKGEHRKVRFLGPTCHGQVEARVDPADVVRELTESDNSRSGACPLS